MMKLYNMPFILFLCFLIPTQLFADNTTLLAELTSSGGGGQEIVWDTDNWQQIAYNYEINLELDVIYNTQRGDIYQYIITGLRGTVHFWGLAEDYYYGSYESWDFNDTHNYDIINPSDGLLEYSVSKGRVTYLQTSLSGGSTDILPYYLQFFGLAHPHTTRLWVSLAGNWYFDEDYDSCMAGIGVDMTDSVILSPHASISYDSSKFKYNTDYPGNWRMVALDASVQASFTLDSVPPSAALVIDHLSSAVAACPGGGYSPVDILVNGNIIASCYDPASNHGGVHSFVTDQWEIAPFLHTGNNTVTVQLCNTACSHYWIRYLSINLPWDDCASCTLETIHVTQISVSENVPIQGVPNVIWSETQPDVFQPVADGQFDVDIPAAGIQNLNLTGTGPNPGPKYKTMPGTKYKIDVDVPAGIGSYASGSLFWEIKKKNDNSLISAGIKDLPINEEIVISANKNMTIGQYILRLTFSFLDSAGNPIPTNLPQPSEYTLYLIHSDPIVNVVEDNLKKATELAEGAKATDPNDILVKIMENFRKQGWIYSNYNFVSGTQLLYSSSKYGNCKSFMDAWRHLADIHGIQTSPHMEGGLYGFGFLTKQATALDNSSGNAYGESGVPDKWFFGKHYIGMYGNLYYDPTFKDTYTSSYQFILEHGIEWGEDLDGKVFAKTDNYRIYQKKLHGPNFLNGLYEYLPRLTISENTITTLFQINSTSAFFSGPYFINGVDSDGDGIYETVKIDTEIDGDEGQYYIGGVLRCGEEVLSVRSDNDSAVFTEDAVILTGSGPDTSSIFFSGEDIFRSGVDGIYTVYLYLTDPNNMLLDEIYLYSDPFSHLSFGEEPTRLAGLADSGIDDDGDGLFNRMALDIDLNIFQPDDYYAVASLSKDPNSPPLLIENGAASTTDPNTIRIVFDGRDIHEIGTDGPYTITVSLYNSNNSYIDSAEYTTAAYTVNMFEMLPVTLTGNNTDYVAYTGNRCPLDKLIINVEVETRDPNVYQIDAGLYASDANIIEIIPLEVQLTQGVSVISFEFDGRKIAEKGFDGPYYLGYVAIRQKNEQGNGYLAIIQNVHQTSAYSACGFNWSTSFLMGDINCNCMVNIEDLILFANQWLQAPGIPSADIIPYPSGDGVVNMNDFVPLADNWLKGIE